MKVSVSGLSNQDSLFANDKYLKLKYDKKKNKYIIQVKDQLSTADKFSRFLSDIFGTECRNISKALNSPEGQERLKKVGNKEVRAHLAEINLKIEQLNKKPFVKKISLINIPNASIGISKPQVKPQGKAIKPLPKIPQKKPNAYLVSFYTNEGNDIENRTLKSIWEFSHKEKEDKHNYIQWLFPLKEASVFNPKAPVLTPELVNELLSHSKMKINLQTSLDSMLDFYGLKWDDTHTEIIMDATFNERSKNWLTKSNHNHLRITRILNCLRHFELESESKAFFNCLRKLKTDNPGKISNTTWKFWEETQR